MNPEKPAKIRKPSIYTDISVKEEESVKNEVLSNFQESETQSMMSKTAALHRNQ
jgi:hypothetical protein